MQTLSPKKIEDHKAFWKDVTLLCWRALPAAILIHLFLLTLPQLMISQNPHAMAWLAILQVAMGPVLYYLLLFAVTARTEKKLRRPVKALAVALAGEWTRKNFVALFSLIYAVLWVASLAILCVSILTGEVYMVGSADVALAFNRMVMEQVSTMYMFTSVMLGVVTLAALLKLDLGEGERRWEHLFPLVAQGIAKNYKAVVPMGVVAMVFVISEVLGADAKAYSTAIQSGLLYVLFAHGAVMYLHVFRGEGLTRKQAAMDALPSPT